MADGSTAEKYGFVCPCCYAEFTAPNAKGFSRHKVRPIKVVSVDGVRYVKDLAGGLLKLINGTYCPFHRGMKDPAPRSPK